MTSPLRLGRKRLSHLWPLPPVSDGSDIRILLYDGSDVGALPPGAILSRQQAPHALSHLGAGLRIGPRSGLNSLLFMNSHLNSQIENYSDLNTCTHGPFELD